MNLRDGSRNLFIWVGLKKSHGNNKYNNNNNNKKEGPNKLISHTMGF
jgi:hypothetical protein